MVFSSLRSAPCRKLFVATTESATPANNLRQMDGRVKESRLTEKLPGLYDESVPRRLPSGKHSLSPEYVHATQRVRLMEAVMEVIGRVGFKRATVALITDEAGVSRRTFYQHFSDAEVCLIESYREHAKYLIREVAFATADLEDWEVSLDASTAHFLAFSQDHPGWARTYSSDAMSTSPRMLDARYEADEMFIAVYRVLQSRMAQADPTVVPASDNVLRAIIGATAEVIRSRIRTDELATIHEIAPVISGVIKVVLGAPMPVEQITGRDLAKAREALAGRGSSATRRR